MIFIENYMLIVLFITVELTSGVYKCLRLRTDTPGNESYAVLWLTRFDTLMSQYGDDPAPTHLSVQFLKEHP